MGRKAERSASLASTANAAARAAPGEIGRGPSRRGRSHTSAAVAVITDSAPAKEPNVDNG